MTRFVRLQWILSETVGGSDIVPGMFVMFDKWFWNGIVSIVGVMSIGYGRPYRVNFDSGQRFPAFYFIIVA